MKLIFKGLLMVAMLIPSLVNAQKAKDIKLNLEKGQNYTQETTTSMSIKQNVMGQAMNINMEIENTSIYNVTSVDGSNFSLDVSFTEFDLGIEMGPQIQSFSSNSGAADPFSKILSAMIGKKFQVVLSNKGEVVKVDGFDEFWDKVIAETQDIPAAQRDQVLAQLKESYRNDQYAKNLELLMKVYPSEPVKKKASWTIDSKLTGVVEADVKSTYTLTDITKEAYIIDAASTITTDPNNKKTKMVNGVPARFEGGGTITSSYKISTETGWIISANVNQEIKGNNIMNMGGNEMNVPMEVSSVAVIKEGNVVK